MAEKFSKSNTVGLGGELTVLVDRLDEAMHAYQLVVQVVIHLGRLQEAVAAQNAQVEQLENLPRTAGGRW